MEKLYFDCIDSILRLRIPKLKYIFSFFYLLFFILLFLLIPNHTPEEKFISVLFVSVFILLSPMLMVPSWHFINSKNYFVYRKFIKILNSSNISYSNISFLYDNKNNLVDYRSYKWLKYFCIDLRYIPTKEFIRDINKSTNPLFGKKKIFRNVLGKSYRNFYQKKLLNISNRLIMIWNILKNYFLKMKV